jgi:hypothetical protein
MLFLNTYPLDLVYVELGDQFWGDSGDRHERAR